MFKISQFQMTVTDKKNLKYLHIELHTSQASYPGRPHMFME